MQIHVPRYSGVRGLPARSVTITNTERRKAFCGRRWWFRYPERLQSPQTRPLSYGNAWHDCMEDVHLWWMQRDTVYPGDGVVCAFCGGLDDIGEAPDGYSDCPRCDGTGKGPIERYRMAMLDAAMGDAALFTVEEIMAERDRLFWAFDGWLHTYGREPYASYRVVAVEVPLARPIVHPRSGRPYTPELYYVRQGRDLRLAGTGEVSGEKAAPEGSTIEIHRWPWYQVAKLDCVLQHRTTGVIYVGEWKSSSSPRQLIEGLNVDPQTDGYVWVLEYAVANGLLGMLRGDVRGYLYDVTSSSEQHAPKLLAPAKVQQVDDQGRPLFIERGERKPECDLVNKGRRKAWLLDDEGEPVLRSPGLSRDTRKTIPSWRYAAEIVKHGFDPADYKDVLAELRERVDPRLYMREFGTAGAEPRARYAEEIYAVARRHADMHRQAARARDYVDINVHFPRVPVCRLPGGSCPYRGPCSEDGESARANYETAEVQTWEGV